MRVYKIKYILCDWFYCKKEKKKKLVQKKKCIPTLACQEVKNLKRQQIAENLNRKTLFYKDCSLGSVKNLSNT